MALKFAFYKSEDLPVTSQLLSKPTQGLAAIERLVSLWDQEWI